jgi:hypothetical protein
MANSPKNINYVIDITQISQGESPRKEVCDHAKDTAVSRK